ncbi:MAG: caspase family protein [Pseudomonadota bacterium]|nr:caspase family protein [Pseudomonadota bacterium]
MPSGEYISGACRSSPFKSFVRSGSTGLTQMNAPKGTIVGYATSPSKEATDGAGKNSPYALGLVRAINMPGITIESVLKQTLIWVDETTNRKQVPWYESSLRGDFYFSRK